MSLLNPLQKKAVLQAIENLGGQEYCTLDKLFNEHKFSSDAFDSGWTWWDKDEVRNDEDLFWELHKFADDMLKTSSEDYRNRLSELKVELNPLLYYDFKTCFYNYVLPPYRYDDDDQVDNDEADQGDDDEADQDNDVFFFDLAELDADSVLNTSLETFVTAGPIESENEE